jgi:hypothetical protein
MSLALTGRRAPDEIVASRCAIDLTDLNKRVVEGARSNQSFKIRTTILTFSVKVSLFGSSLGRSW